MRARDLKKLKPGDRLTFTRKVNQELYKYWKNKTIYVHQIDTVTEGVQIRSSKRVTAKTTYGFFWTNEIQRVKE